MKYLVLLPIFLMLAGCAGNPVPVAYKVERAPLNLPNPAPLVLNDVELKGINKDNAKTIMDQVDAGFLIDEDNYKALRVNLQKLVNKIAEYKVVLDQYHLYYEPPKPKQEEKK